MTRIVAIAIALLAASWALAAAAAPPQKTYDMTQALTDTDGTPIKDINDPAHGEEELAWVEWAQANQGLPPDKRTPEPARDPNCAKCRPLTVGNYIVFLVRNGPDAPDRNATAEIREKYGFQSAAREVWADKIKDDAAAHVTEKEAALAFKLSKLMSRGIVVEDMRKIFAPDTSLPDVE